MKRSVLFNSVTYLHAGLIKLSKNFPDKSISLKTELGYISRHCFLNHKHNKKWLLNNLKKFELTGVKVCKKKYSEHYA